MGYALPECSHYQILGVTSSASLADIKAAYRASLLRLHPDKAGFGARPIASFAANPAEWEKAKSPAEHNDAEFAAVQTAWHVLRDADGRAAYDRWLTAQRTQADVAIADCLDLDDLTELLDTSSQQHGSGNDGRWFAYPCRCGSQFALRETDLSDAADSIVVGCAGCSLHVRVHYTVG